MSMNQLFEFLQNHWLLAAAFLAVLILIIVEEVRSKGLGTNSIDPQKAVHMINREDAVVLDIREANAFQSGHMVGAVNFPLASLDQNAKKLNKYRSRHLIVVCAAGQASLKAMAKLKEAGFEQVSVLKGGIAAWKNADMPVVTGKGEKTHGKD